MKNITTLLFLLIFHQILSAQSFAEKTGVPFEPVLASTVNFSDVDGDGDQDVLITGVNRDNLTTAKLYTNDGLGNFTEVLDTPFAGVSDGTAAFLDVNGDTFPDLLLMGSVGGGGGSTKLYLNNGTGQFVEDLDAPFDPLRGGEISVADIDGDGDMDLLLTGRTNDNVNKKEMYTNDGLGNFTKVINPPFDNPDINTITFVDVDADGDPDVVATEPALRLFDNDGTGNFVEVANNPFPNLPVRQVVFADINGDMYPDLLLSSYPSGGNGIVKMYLNNLGIFTEVSSGNFTYGTEMWVSDKLQNNDQYVLISGRSNEDMVISRLYKNDNTGTFFQVNGIPFVPVEFADADFADVDGDGDIDVLISGWKSPTWVSRLYLNQLMVSTVQPGLPSVLSVYPNPTSGMVEIPITAPTQIDLYGISGNLIRTFFSPGHQIDLSDQRPGYYFLRILTDKEVYTASVLKQ